MKIKLLKNVGIDGKHTPAGTVVDAPHTLAKDLIGSGRAVAVEDEAEAEVVTSTEGTTPFPEASVESTSEPESEPAKPTRKNTK